MPVILPEPELAGVLRASRFEPGASGMPERPQALRVRLEEVRRDGVAITDWARVNGLRVMAAPVLDANRPAVAALSVAAPANSGLR